MSVLVSEMSVLVSEEEFEPIRTISGSEHVGNLFLGIFVGLLVMLFTRCSQATHAVATLLPSPKHRGRNLLLRLGAIFVILLLMKVILLGP